MLYTTTSTSRRVVQVKVKRRSAQRNMWTTPGRGAAPSFGPAVPAAGLSVPVRVAMPVPWYQTWKIAALLGLLSAAAIAAAIGANSAQSARGERRASTPQEKAQRFIPPVIRDVNGIEVVQVRPMGYTPSANRLASAPAPAGFPVGGGARITESRPTDGGLPASPGRTQPQSEASGEAVVMASLGGNGKIVLPEDAAGNCAIADTGLKDLGACLAKNGARSQ